MDKAPEAFRTISEVAAALGTPAHVLRFWESRFPQIRPVKRAGGRRYYRPADVALLAGIRRLLHDEGMTIRGVQKILREQGVRHVAGLCGGDTSPEEEALARAMAARFDAEPQFGPEEAAGATAEALRTALAAPVAASSTTPGAAILPFPGDLARAAPPVAAEAPGAAAPDPVAPGGGVAQPAGADAGKETPVETTTGDTAATAPTTAPATGDTAAAPARAAGRSHAARLRNLPRGALTHERAALVALRRRLGALAARMALPIQEQG